MDSRAGYRRVVEEEDYEIKAALAGVEEVFQLMEVEEAYCVETDSVYGAVIALPQIARSAGWTPTYTALAVRTYLLFVCTFFLQTSLLLNIGEAISVMAPLGGQMHLCDFGANLDECPEGHGCVGPGGTLYTKTRLYSYMQWNIQNFVKNSLKAVLPDKEDLIDKTVDPGEYGMENSFCRFTCLFIFTMAMVNELYSIMDLASLHYHVPTKRDLWVKYVPLSQADVPRMQKFLALGLVEFQTAGMPLLWKIWNMLGIFLPKVVVWWFAVWEGYRLLMETAGILDLVLGAMSMAFILEIDEMILSCFSTSATKHILGNIQPWISEEEAMVIEETDQECIDRIRAEARTCRPLGLPMLMVPKRLLLVATVMGVFITKYYLTNCDRQPDGYWISKPMYLPEDSTYTVTDFVRDTIRNENGKPFWTMPVKEN